WTKDTQTAAFDHRGTAHPDVGAHRSNDYVAASQQRGVAREASPRNDADQRHQPAKFRKIVERSRILKAAVSVARPSAAAFGEQYQRQSQLTRDLEHPIFFAMVLISLRAGQHRVVVRHDDTARLGGAEQISIDGRQSGDEAVGWSVLDQVVHLAAAALRGDNDRPVLDERARVAQFVDIFASCPLTCLSPARYRVGAGSVETDFVPLVHLREVCAHAARIDLVIFVSSRPHVGSIVLNPEKRRTLQLPEPIHYRSRNAGGFRSRLWKPAI